MYLSIYLSIYRCIYLSISLIYLSLYTYIVCVCVCVCMCVCVCVCVCICVLVWVHVCRCRYHLKNVIKTDRRKRKANILFRLICFCCYYEFYHITLSYVKIVFTARLCNYCINIAYIRTIA